MGGERVGRYSFLGTGPYRHFEATGSTVRRRAAGADWSTNTETDPLKQLEDELAQVRVVNLPGLPRFCGGAVGYASYDAARYVEHLPAAPRDDRYLPDLCFSFYDTMIVFDHVTKLIHVVAHAADSAADYHAALGKIDALVARLQTPTADLPLRDLVPRGSVDPARYTPNLTRAEFESVVRRGIDYINAGDIFQFVPSQRFRTETTARPFDIYRALRVVNPSPF
ncbi:MAG: anthranilate synthase component I, partial [Gemmataceae bacterium]